MDIKTIAEIAERYQKRSAAPFGFVFKDLKTGECVACRGDEVFPTASAFKIFVLAELYRSVAAGERSLNDRVELRDDMRSMGGGLLEIMDAGICPTLHDYALLMMTISDNTATDILMDVLGKDNIRRNVLEALGLEKSRSDLTVREMIDHYYGLGGRSKEAYIAEHGALPDLHKSSWFACTEAENDQSTPLEMCRMLETLYRGEWVSPEVSAQVLDVMKLCQTNRRIPRLLPRGIAVAHKTGSFDRLNVDVGIVYSPAGDYILCTFYNGPLADREAFDRNVYRVDGEDLIAELSLEIYNAYTQANS